MAKIRHKVVVHYVGFPPKELTLPSIPYSARTTRRNSYISWEGRGDDGNWWIVTLPLFNVLSVREKVIES
jgi:hypothetical protein